jgi:hypothetical protein
MSNVSWEFGNGVPQATALDMKDHSSGVYSMQHGIGVLADRQFDNFTCLTIITHSPDFSNYHGPQVPSHIELHKKVEKKKVLS